MKAVSRRSFLQAALAASAFPLLPVHGAFGRDKVRLACVGVGQQAWHDIQQFSKTGFCEVVALCDTDIANGKQCNGAKKKFPKVPRFSDFRKMLDAMDGKIDAVAVMNPDFSHFPALMAAMKRGLGVFSEKPLAHTFEECELLMAAEKKYGVVTQMGNQGHSGENYYQFKEYVEKGIIDISKLTRLCAHMNSARRWHKWNGNVTAFPDFERTVKGEVSKMTPGLDWDTWTGTATPHAYSKDYVQGEWRSWFDFGNGALGDWGAHTMDTMHRFFELGLPTEVIIKDVTGWNPFVFPMQDTLNFKFAAKGKRPACLLEWYEGVKNLPRLPKGHKSAAWDASIPQAGGSSGSAKSKSLNPGKFFELSNGDVWFGGSHSSQLDKAGVDRKDLPKWRKNGSNHYANFLLSVMGKEKTRSPFSVTGPLSEVFCLGCIAQRLNRGFKFDPATKQIVGDAEANALLKGSKGTPRKGWEEFYRV